MLHPFFLFIHVVGLVTGDTKSPWATSEWRVAFNFGKDIDGNDVNSNDKNNNGNIFNNNGDNWGKSGARLGLSIDVLIESESYPNPVAEREFIGGSGASNIMSVLSDASYVTIDKGQQLVRFGPTGAWKLSSRRTGRPGDASVLRFWIDVIDSAIRNDVSIQKGERLYATANCWREVDYEIGAKRLQPYQKRLDEIQNTITARLDHSTGDRRLDGTDIVETALGSIDMAVLMNERDEALLELRTMQQKLPGMTAISKPGYWPGSDEKLIIAEGKVGVKRRKGLWEEFHILGTWMASPLNVVAGSYYDEVEEESSIDSS